MTAPTWADVAGALGVPARTMQPIDHQGCGQVARVHGVGIVKIYPRASDYLAQAQAAARVIDRSGVRVGPGLLARHDVGLDHVALVFEEVQGSKLPVAFLESEELRASLVETLSALHGDHFSRDLSGDPQGPREWPVFLTTQLALAGARFERRTGVRPSSVYLDAVESVRQWVAIHEADLLTAAPALVHRDVFSGNLLVQEDGSIRLIDFDLAAWYDPLFDLVKLQIIHGATSQHAWRALVSRYCQVAAIDQEQVMRRYTASKALEVIWGYPALLSWNSPIARTWADEIENLVSIREGR